MFDFIHSWLDRRVIARSTISPEQWNQAFAALPVLHGLGATEQDRLRELAILFLHRKAFEGAHGMTVTREMALEIALQACLPILKLVTNPFAPDQTIEIPKIDIVSREPSTVSAMPAGLINTLNQQEILDLLAYIESGGNPNHLAFQ